MQVKKKVVKLYRAILRIAPTPMKLFIKNMVCARCISVVKAELEGFGLTTLAVQLGEADIAEEITSQQKQQLSTVLAAIGFELYDE